MRIYFYSLTEQPTAHRLEPSLEEVFHNPATYRKYFKPMMAVELSEIVPGMSGVTSIPARSSCTCLSGMATGSCISPISTVEWGWLGFGFHSAGSWV